MPLHFALKEASCRGPALLSATLYDLGPYPGLKLEPGRVIGMVYTVDEDTLKDIDALEDYYPDIPEGSEYQRRDVQVQLLTDAQVIPCQTYVYAQDLSEARLVSCGDYRRYIQEKSGDTVRILSYGSNLDPERLEKRVGPVKEYLPGILQDFKMVFSFIHPDGTTRANLAYSPGESCPAAATELNTGQLEKLDQAEGVASGYYIRIVVPFLREDGEVLWGQAYVAHPGRVGPEAPPPDDYLDFIHRGYARWGWCLPLHSSDCDHE